MPLKVQPLSSLLPLVAERAGLVLEYSSWMVSWRNRWDKGGIDVTLSALPFGVEVGVSPSICSEFYIGQHELLDAVSQNEAIRTLCYRVQLGMLDMPPLTFPG